MGCCRFGLVEMGGGGGVGVELANKWFFFFMPHMCVNEKERSNKKRNGNMNSKTKVCVFVSV